MNGGSVNSVFSSENVEKQARLKHLAKINPGKSEVSDLNPKTEVSFVALSDFGVDGEINTSETRELGDVYEGYTYFREGDIAIAKITPSFENGKGAICQGLKNEIGFGTTELHVLRPREGIDTNYLWYILRSKPFRSKAKTAMRGVAGQQRVPSDFIKNFKIGCPNERIQSNISSLLDKDKEIFNRLIEGLNTVSGLVKERHEASTLQAVTGELTHSDKQEDSGVQWLGQVPKHWEVRPLKWCVEEAISGPYGSSLTKSMYTETGPRVYGQQEVIANDFDVTDYRISDQKFEEMHQYSVQANDLLVTVMGTIGEATVVPSQAEKGIINPRLVKYKLNEEITLPKFIECLINSYGIQAMLQQKANGTTMEGLNMTILGNLRIPVPPISEQREIIQYIKERDTILKSAQDAAQSGIEALRERRQALITSAVTGQIDITEDQSPELGLPHE